MKKIKPTYLLFALLGLSAIGITYAASTDWIFCTSFESPGTSCSAGVGPIEQVEGANGNLWDSMNWNQGNWQ